MANWLCGVLLKSGFLFLLFVCSVILFAPMAQAMDEAPSDEKPVIAPEIYRRPIDESKIDSENFEVTAFSGLMSVEDFGVNTLIGARLAFHVTEGVFFEASLGQVKTSKTSYERLNGSVELLTAGQRVLSYYDLSVGYNLLPGEAFLTRTRAFNTAFYLIAGIGSTSFAGDDRYTINYGFGYRFLANDWLALHADVRNHVFDMELLGAKTSTNNLEMSIGLSVFF